MIKLRVIVCTLLLLSACSMRPEVVTQDEQKQIIEQDRQAIFAGQTAITTKLDLYGAMARALRYNVDYRTKLFEKQVALGQYDLSKYKFLPAFRVNGGVNYRSNLPIADSLDTSTNLPLPSFATASDRTIRNVDVRMIWNLLDFGVTYYQVKQEGNKALIADEARRKIVSELLRDVRSAYWKAAIAQKVQPQIERILGEAREALVTSSKTQSKGLVSPVKVLQYRKTLMKLIDTLEGLYNQMITAKTQLSSLINEPLDHKFELDVPEKLPMDVAEVPFCLEKMEDLALLNKPEIRQEIYRKRISVAETRKATLRMLPGLQLSSGESYSSNSFLHNNSWTTAGAQVTWNIFNILSGPANIKHAKMKESVADHRRMALQMAVLTKVHLAYRDYLHRRYQLKRSTALDDLEIELTGYIRNAAQKRAKSHLELIQAEVSELSAGLKRANAYSALQQALAYIYDSMGVDPLPNAFNKVDIGDLRNLLAHNIGTWTKAETAPFNWACYAPEREDQSYDEDNFRIPKKELEKVVAEVSAGKDLNEDQLAERVADKVAERFAERIANKVVDKMDGSPKPDVKQLKKDVKRLDKAMRTSRKLETVAFGATGAELSPQSTTTLDRASRFLRDHPDLKIEAIGFSDNNGTLVETHRRSAQRARVVYRYLVKHGVERSRIAVKSYGPASPVASNATAEGRARNRRVELYVVKYPFDYVPLINMQRMRELQAADAANNARRQNSR